MPQVQLYFTEEEYNKFLQEAIAKKTKVTVLLTEKLKEAIK